MLCIQNQPLKLNSKYILFMAMIYTTAMLAANVVAFKFVFFHGFIESGATIIFPFTYVIGDVMCEVYGWNISIKIIFLGLLCEMLFALLITIVIHMPSYGLGGSEEQYISILGNMWLFVAGGVIANSVAAFLNIYFISKWKILAKGKVFWLRSIISTCISEFILIMIIMLIAFAHLFKMEMTMRLFIDAYSLEIIYAFIFVLPAQFLVNFIRKKEGIDAFDYGVSYNPFKLFYAGDFCDNRYFRSDVGRDFINKKIDDNF